MSPKFGFKLLAGALLAASSAAALAAQAWSVDLQNGAATVTGSNYTTVRTYVTGSGADTLTLSASAYSNTGTNNGGSTVDNSNNNLLESAYLYRGSGWQGLGVLTSQGLASATACCVVRQALPPLWPPLSNSMKDLTHPGV